MQGHDHSQVGQDNADEMKMSDGEKMSGMDHSKMQMQAGTGMAGMEHGAIDLSGATRATGAQKFVWAFLSLALLATGLIFSATLVNLNLSARDVGGAIM